jgi:hypothetical protein
MKFHHTTVFEMAVVVSYVVYIGTILGISVLAPEYIDMVRDFIHIYVAIFLLWRFRPPFLGGEKIGVFGSFDRVCRSHYQYIRDSMSKYSRGIVHVVQCTGLA